MLFDKTSQLLLGADGWIGFLIVTCPNGTSIAFRNATDNAAIPSNPVWVCLDATGQFKLGVKLSSGSSETFVHYVVVGSLVGQKTVTQGAP